ncbi:hypothetical protein HYV49_03230 [Candidatus Pacearchaeota archaeon]|nr:hypothetical protein [Candidatus Pacearchaeota archaeon]
MGFFDFFKKEKPAIKHASFDELDSIILKKKQEIRINELKVIEYIKNRVSLLLNEFDKEIISINNVNLNDKKDDEKFKLIVRGNLDRYADHLINLRYNLAKMQFDDMDDIKKIDSAFQDFEKKSFMNFEKATFLIGKEIGEVVDSIKRFFTDIKKITGDNKEIIDDLKAIGRTNKIIYEIKGFEQIKINLVSDADNIRNNINNLMEEIGILRANMEDIAISRKYNEWLIKKKEFDAKKDKLKLEISELREKIDFKELARIYHSNEKQMGIIKEYRENFHQAFEKDDGERILSIIDKDKEEIKEIIDKIIKTRKGITEYDAGADAVLERENKIREIEDKIRELTNEKLKIEKKIQKTEEKIKDAKSILKQETIHLNLELV